MTSSAFLVVFVTASSSDEAHRIAGTLVEEGIAACVNVVPAVASVYRWKGKIVRDDEVLLIIKTSQARFGELERRVLELHSYDVPEIVGLDIAAVSDGYADFLGQSLG
jgi:periplasmic divalent cation tolerance protein